jgi:hypothetical protein
VELLAPDVCTKINSNIQKYLWSESYEFCVEALEAIVEFNALDSVEKAKLLSMRKYTRPVSSVSRPVSKRIPTSEHRKRLSPSFSDIGTDDVDDDVSSVMRKRVSPVHDALVVGPRQRGRPKKITDENAPPAADAASADAAVLKRVRGRPKKTTFSAAPAATYSAATYSAAAPAASEASSAAPPAYSSVLQFGPTSLLNTEVFDSSVFEDDMLGQFSACDDTMFSSLASSAFAFDHSSFDQNSGYDAFGTASFGAGCASGGAFDSAYDSLSSLMQSSTMEPPLLEPRKQRQPRFSADVRTENLTTLARASLDLQSQFDSGTYVPPEPFMVISNRRDLEKLVSNIKGGRFARKGDGSGTSRGGNNRALPEKTEYLKQEIEQSAKKGISFLEVQTAVRDCKSRWFTRA